LRLKRSVRHDYQGEKLSKLKRMEDFKMSMKPQELRANLKGVIHLVMTPFNERDELDEGALRTQLRHSVNSFKGEEVVFLAGGSTAEFYAMSDEECKRYMKIVVEEVGGKFPVLLGTGRAGTKYTLEISLYAQEIGADGVLVVSPYYHAPTADGIYRHFKILNDELTIGIVVYNNPVTSSVWIPPTLMAKLSKLPNVVGDKDNISSITALYRMYRTIDPQDMSVFTGIGFDMYQYAALFGCPGYVAEFGNFVPHIAIEMYKAGKKRDFETLVALNQKMDSLVKFMGGLASRRAPIPTTASPLVSIAVAPYYQSVCKVAMDLIGIPGGKVREPMENLTTEEKAELKQILIELGCKVI
jgi:4-hydroxy-tetrahydrodipicolinate synthase